MQLRFKEMQKMYAGLGPEQFTLQMTEAIKANHIRPEEVSIRVLAETTLGATFVREMDPTLNNPVSLTEAGVVDSTAFSNITGQLIISTLLAAYENEEFVATKMVRNISTKLSGEKIPGITGLKEGDVAVVGEGMPYPHAGFGEDYIETPATVKRGLIIPVTREAIFFDRTHLVLQRATEVGEVMGLNKEKRILDVIVGATNNYNRMGTSSNTYQGSTPWVNVQDSTALEDWTDMDLADNLFAEMLDPNTNEPILLSGRQLFVPPQLASVATRIVSATEIRTATNSSAQIAIWGNRFLGLELASSRQLYRRLLAAGNNAASSKSHWFYGDFNKAFAYMENWPITVSKAPLNSEAEFEQDIIIRYKASERGVAVVMEPRAMTRNKAS